jgi:GT2 family glycosyltransferase
MASRPEISVVVASRDRPLRLRWLLNALEEQTLAAGRWEVVVGHDSHDSDAEELLRTHALARAGVLRHAALPPGSTSAGAKRNAALRLAQGDLIAFTHDDCRPPPEWLERALAAGRRSPGAVLQGTTRPDPDEAALLGAPHPQTQDIVPPVPWAQACNVVYPRELVDRLGGFDEDLPVGEDTDLAIRAREAGATYQAAPEVVTYHAVRAQPLPAHLHRTWRWRDLPEVVRRHPALRREIPLGIFWTRAHAWLPLAVVGCTLARRRAGFALLAVPWAMQALPDHGPGLRGRARAVSELPLLAAVDAAEMGTLAAGSLRHRTLFL